MAIMNYGGSLRYDMHGRKRKAYKKNNPTVRRNTKASPPKDLKPSTRLEEMRTFNEKYPSLQPTKENKRAGGKMDHKWQQEKLKISQGYTIAPAYNKGAYQVIGKNNIKDIGK